MYAEVRRDTFSRMFREGREIVFDFFWKGEAREGGCGGSAIGTSSPRDEERGSNDLGGFGDGDTEAERGGGMLVDLRVGVKIVRKREDRRLRMFVEWKWESGWLCCCREWAGLLMMVAIGGVGGCLLKTLKGHVRVSDIELTG